MGRWKIVLNSKFQFPMAPIYFLPSVVIRIFNSKQSASSRNMEMDEFIKLKFDLNMSEKNSIARSWPFVSLVKNYIPLGRFLYRNGNSSTWQNRVIQISFNSTFWLHSSVCEHGYYELSLSVSCEFIESYLAGTISFYLLGTANCSDCPISITFVDHHQHWFKLSTCLVIRDKNKVMNTL